MATDKNYLDQMQHNTETLAPKMCGNINCLLDTVQVISYESITAEEPDTTYVDSMVNISCKAKDCWYFSNEQQAALLLAAAVMTVKEIGTDDSDITMI